MAEIELLNFTPWRDWVKMKHKFLGRISVPRRLRRRTPSPNFRAKSSDCPPRLISTRNRRQHGHGLFQRKLDSPRPIRRRVSAGLKRIRGCGLKIGPGKIVMAKVRREDWAESWKRHFRPIEIGDALLVKPSWSKTQAAERSGGGGAGSRLELRHGPSPHDGVLPASNCRGGPRPPKTALTGRRHGRIVSGHWHRLGNFVDCRGKIGLSSCLRHWISIRKRSGLPAPMPASTASTKS